MPLKVLATARAASGGMVSRATTRITPTTWISSTTVSAINTRSRVKSARTGTPWTKAKVSSNAAEQRAEHRDDHRADPRVDAQEGADAEPAEGRVTDAVAEESDALGDHEDPEHAAEHAGEERDHQRVLHERQGERRGQAWRFAHASASGRTGRWWWQCRWWISSGESHESRRSTSATRVTRLAIAEGSWVTTTTGISRFTSAS